MSIPFSHRRTRTGLALGFAAAALALVAGCTSTQTQRVTGVLQYLYPEGKDLGLPSDVELQVPARVGVAFVPEAGPGGTGPLDANEKQVLLQRVADAFRAEEGVAGIEVVPSSYLTHGGGFDEVDRLRALFGIDLIALISYDQTQYEDLKKVSLTYWTIVGAYVVPGNANGTNTFVEASIFDVRARALLFNASGQSQLTDRSTAIDSPQALREERIEGFGLAVDDLIVQLDGALDAFREQARTGTVRGAGTPAITVTESSTSTTGVGAGAVGPLELGLALLLAAGALADRRRRTRAPEHRRPEHGGPGHGDPGHGNPGPHRSEIT